MPTSIVSTPSGLSLFFTSEGFPISSISHTSLRQNHGSPSIEKILKEYPQLKNVKIKLDEESEKKIGKMTNVKRVVEVDIQ